MQALAASNNSVARAIVAIAEAREAAAAGPKPGPTRSSAFTSVAKRFADDINALIAALNSTTAHFVRSPPDCHMMIALPSSNCCLMTAR